MENNEFWKKPQSLDPRWEHRTKFICELIPNNITKILDIGAGNDPISMSADVFDLEQGDANHIKD